MNKTPSQISPSLNKEKDEAKDKSTLWGTGLYVGLIITSICIIISVILYRDRLIVNLTRIDDIFQQDRAIAIGSIFILPGLIFAYLVAYGFKKDKFFFFVAVSWIHNLVYLVFIEGWLPRKTYPTNPYNDILPLFQALLSFSSDFYLYIAAHSLKEKKITLKGIIIPSSFFLLWIVVFFINPSYWSIDNKINFFFIIGPIFSFYVLFITGIRVKGKFEASKHLTILSFTFIIYAILQLPFVTVRFIDINKNVLFYIFWISLTLKVINGYSLIRVLWDDFAGWLKLFQSKKEELASTSQKITENESVISNHNKKIEEQRKKILDINKLLISLTTENKEKEEEILKKNEVLKENEEKISSQDEEILKKTNEILRVKSKLDLLTIENESKEKELLQKSEFEDIGVLTAAIEHELRNPLAIVYNIVDFLRNKNQADLNKVVEMLGNALHSMLAATDIVNILRAEDKKIKEKMDVVELNPFFKSKNGVIEKMKKEFLTKKEFIDHQKKHIYYKFNENKEKLFIKGFPFLLEKVFINFLRNSIESGFTNKDSVEIIIEIGTNEKGKVYINIIDNGVGFIDKDGNKIPNSKIREKVIKAGYSTKNINGLKANRGIGLFVCDRILKIHKGKMEFFNLEKRGAKITITMDRYIVPTNSNSQRTKDIVDKKK